MIGLRVELDKTTIVNKSTIYLMFYDHPNTKTIFYKFHLFLNKDIFVYLNRLKYL